MMDELRIHKLNTDAYGELPQQFTNPFCYEPHPLCVAAAELLKAELCKHAEWMEDAQKGKMFGVLVVEGGFLAAFSGFLNRQNNIDYFVPPIFDLLDPTGYFQQEQAEITKITKAIQTIEGENNMDLNPKDFSRRERVNISALKRQRHQRSELLQDWLFEQYICKNAWGDEKTITQIFKDFYRETMLHKEHYEENERKHHIPSGSGECCAPKLLQYAYTHDLKPLCMAEFWIGASPKDEVRYEGQFYPACSKKCRPLLHFMLKGLEVEESFLDRHNRELLNLVEVLYEDDVLLVVNKPSGLLSVPSRDTQASVVDWLHQIHSQRLTDAGSPYPLADSAPVHRLDQDTSGVLIIAKSHDALRNLQAQFYHHEVRKTYIALLDGCPSQCSGIINLPLRKDPIDLPRQMVDYEHGKPSLTRYEVLNTEEGWTRVAFYPETGRTHQLRMHAAHHDGLGCPIVGDKLYGRRRNFVTPSSYQSLLGQRLMLHAFSIDFQHPTTGQSVHIECPAPF